MSTPQQGKAMLSHRVNSCLNSEGVLNNYPNMGTLGHFLRYEPAVLAEPESRYIRAGPALEGSLIGMVELRAVFEPPRQSLIDSIVGQ